MKKMETVDDYLARFYSLVFDSTKNRSREIQIYYKKIRKQFYTTCEAVSPYFFEKSEALLALEARLQILVELLLVRDKFNYGYTDKEIVNMVETDYSSYYRELTGINKNESSTWGRFYLSEI